MSTLDKKLGHNKETGRSMKNDLTQSTVLAVDDQPICLTVLSKLIEATGSAVETAKNGEEALLLWEKKHHSLIFTDCNMPKMNGYHLTSAIRQIENTKGLAKSTIVALTSHETEEEMELCKQAGVNIVISKPIDSEQIKVLLSDWLATKTNQQHDYSASDKNNQTPVDLTILAQIFPEASKQINVLSDLRTHLCNDYQALKRSIQKENIAEIGNLAHRMKGSCRMVGANHIANTCEHIETGAKAGFIVEDELLTTLEEDIHQFDVYLTVQQRNLQRQAPNSTQRAN